ncbi:MAG: hypothetical protein SFY56_16050 [Bacteroidota bacterium]|nr:hypothetical protein [Bacteroidota bacterium]
MQRQLKIVIIILLLLQGFVSFSQNDKDKVEALRVAFIGKKLDLTTNESEKFWPIYNEYNDKIKAIRKNLRQSFKKGIDNMSDKELEELYVLEIKSKQAEAEQFKLFNDKIKVIIGTKKTLKLRVAEEEFKKEIIKTIQEKSD